MKKKGSLSVGAVVVALSFAWLSAGIPAFGANAQETEVTTTREFIDKANYLQRVLENLLSGPSFSSIREVTENGDEQVHGLIEQAMQQKALGEDSLKRKMYPEAIVNFQSSIDFIFKAIRTAKNPGTYEQHELADKLTERLASNETFISAAARVVAGESNADAVEYLQKAREGRRRAQELVRTGGSEEALRELEHSTVLAKLAIISVRGGKVVER